MNVDWARIGQIEDRAYNGGGGYPQADVRYLLAVVAALHGELLRSPALSVPGDTPKETT